MEMLPVVVPALPGDGTHRLPGWELAFPGAQGRRGTSSEGFLQAASRQVPLPAVLRRHLVPPGFENLPAVRVCDLARTSKVCVRSHASCR